MATDRDDDVSRRYRSLAHEEPPAAIDAAILAASRRAAGARPGGIKRWGPPLSIAAMLVLASGVVLRMQSEKPGVENAMPAPAEPPATLPIVPQAPAPVDSVRATPRANTESTERLDARDHAQEPPRQRSKAEVSKPQVAAPLRKESKRALDSVPSPAAAPVQEPPSARHAEETDGAPAATATLPARASPPPAPAAFPAQTRSTEAAPAPPQAPRLNLQAAPAASPSQPATASPAPPSRPAAAAAAAGAITDNAARRDSLNAERRAKSTLPSSPEAALEAIARLRDEARDDEADRALEAFRREFPDYRIPEAQWSRVKPRER